MARTPEARKVLRDLGKELESASRRSGQTLEWSAAERAFLGLISANLTGFRTSERITRRVRRRS